MHSVLIRYTKGSNSSTECLGIHLGGPQSANLGDGNGSVNQTVEIRQDFGNSDVGTCGESLVGGNHFRLVNIRIGTSRSVLMLHFAESSVKMGLLLARGRSSLRMSC